jgi:hypothetical protein
LIDLRSAKYQSLDAMRPQLPYPDCVLAERVYRLSNT